MSRIGLANAVSRSSAPGRVLDRRQRVPVAPTSLVEAGLCSCRSAQREPTDRGQFFWG